MNGYAARTEKKKKAIIDAARELFAACGVSSVSIEDIAKKSGVSHVSIYNYFGNKKNLAVAAVASYFDRAIADYENMLEEKIPFSEKFARIMSYKYTQINTVAVHFISDTALEDEAFQKVIREAAYVKAVPVYTRFIELGKAEGAIPEEIPTQTILAFILQVMPLLEQKEYRQSSEEHKKAMLDLILYGIMGLKGGHAEPV